MLSLVRYRQPVDERKNWLIFLVLICIIFSIIYRRICRPDLCNNNAFRVPPTDRFTIVFYDLFVCFFFL